MPCFARINLLGSECAGKCAGYDRTYAGCFGAKCVISALCPCVHESRLTIYLAANHTLPATCGEVCTTRPLTTHCYTCELSGSSILLVSSHPVNDMKKTEETCVH